MLHLTVDIESVTAVISERRPESRATVWYHFTPDLKLKNSSFSDAFRSYHAELRARHELDHDLSIDEEAGLADVRRSSKK